MYIDCPLCNRKPETDWFTLIAEFIEKQDPHAVERVVIDKYALFHFIIELLKKQKAELTAHQGKEIEP